MDDFVLGQGATAEMRGINVSVFVTEEGWNYRFATESGEEVEGPCGPYVQRQEEAQVDAVRAAMGHLDCIGDPLAESLSLHWHPL